MANYNGDVGTYSEPQYTGLREVWMNMVKGGESTVHVAHFASRNKILVRALHLWVRSACTAAGGSIQVSRDTTSIAGKGATSMTTVGTYHCITLTTLNTLATITEVISMETNGTCGGGDFDIMYEYQVLYPATFIGS